MCIFTAHGRIHLRNGVWLCGAIMTQSRASFVSRYMIYSRPASSLVSRYDGFIIPERESPTIYPTMAEAVAFLGLACAAITAYHALYDLASKAYKKRKTKKEELLSDKTRVAAAERAFRKALKSGLKNTQKVLKNAGKREFVKGDGTCLFIEP